MYEGSLAVDPEKSLFKFAAKEDSWGETVPNACRSRLVCLKAKILVAAAGGSLHELRKPGDRDSERDWNALLFAQLQYGPYDERPLHARL
jgi:hypothetical protein